MLSLWVKCCKGDLRALLTWIQRNVPILGGWPFCAWAGELEAAPEPGVGGGVRRREPQGGARNEGGEFWGKMNKFKPLAFSRSWAEFRMNGTGVGGVQTRWKNETTQQTTSWFQSQNWVVEGITSILVWVWFLTLPDKALKKKKKKTL